MRSRQRSSRVSAAVLRASFFSFLVGCSQQSDPRGEATAGRGDGGGGSSQGASFGGASAPGTGGAPTSGGGTAGQGSPAGGGAATSSGGAAGREPIAGTSSAAGGVSTAGASTSGGGGVSGAPASNAGSGGQATNAPTLLGDVAFSSPSQSFKGELGISLTTTVSGAEIRYTTDGTLPTASSTLYDGTPVPITATTQLRAQPFVAGAASGAVSTGLYIARTFEATSTLPILILDGYGSGKSTDKELYLDAAVMVFEPVDGTASLSNLPTLTTRAAYHLRGQSSATFEQRPYRVEFRDNAEKDADYALLGMPADSDWALVPPFYDRSLIRTPFTYALGKDLGLEAPRTAFAEVYVNYEARALAEADYQGIYWVSELIKNSKVRTNLKQLEEEDTTLPKISGGYIWKFEQFAAEEPTLTCTGSNPIRDSLGAGVGGPGVGFPGGGSAGAGNVSAATCWHSLEVVDPEPLNAEQKAWITQYIQQFHDSLHATPIGDYGAYIDLPSFVDYFLVNELSRNMDAYVRSAYYFKDRDGKIKAGPLWDYNFAFGEGSPDVVDPAGGWQALAGRNVNDWYPKLLADPGFGAAVKARWQVVRAEQFSQASLDEHVSTLIAPLAGAIAKDYAKWPVSFMIERAGRSMVPISFPTAETFDGQIQALRAYLSARLNRMDTLIGQL